MSKIIKHLNDILIAKAQSLKNSGF